jgi:hypothetical protein
MKKKHLKKSHIISDLRGKRSTKRNYLNLSREICKTPQLVSSIMVKD